MARQEYHVDDMHCDGCESTVSEAASGVEGVRSVTADHETGDVSVEYDEAVADEADVRAAITEAGYTPTAARS